MSETGSAPQSCRLGVLIPVAACALAAGLIAQPAAAQTGPYAPFGLRLGSTVTWDANVFRVPGSVPDPQAASGISGISDRITTATFGLLFDKFYSQQHFVANVNQTATRYDRFGFLNRDALDYQAAWLWQLTPRISGTLSADRAESIVGFAETQILARNVSVNSKRNLTIDGWLFGGWHLLGGLAQTERKNSQTFFAQPSSNQTSSELGFRYLALSQSSITLTRREIRGVNTDQAVDRVNFIDSGFRIRETALNANWIVSRQSTLNGSLIRTERKNDNISQRDYSALGGELRYSWVPTGRLTMNLSALRAVTPFAADTSATFRVDDTLAFAPTWQVSEKVVLTMNASRQVSSYLGPVVSVAGPPRRDTMRRLGFVASWAVHKKVTLGANLQREARSSSVPGLDFEDTILGATAVLTF